MSARMMLSQTDEPTTKDCWQGARKGAAKHRNDTQPDSWHCSFFAQSRVKEMT
jgi:hypothetical protein